MTAPNPCGKKKDRRQPRRATIAPRVLAFIQKHCLVAGGEPLLVAVSGGPDSVCLLHLLAGLHDQDLSLHIAHLNHKLRPEADDEASYVAGLARKLQLPATIDERDVKSHQKKHRQSLEEAARQVRYQFLAEVARDIGASRVAVAHTRDDHVETILLHLVRGSGTRGLKGLEPLSKWRDKATGDEITVVRPLLETSRQETLDYCAEHHLEPRLDASNLSLSPLRNRLRHQLIPLLKSYNPAVSEALVRLGHIAGDDIAHLANEAARLWPGVAEEKNESIAFNRDGFDRLPVVPQRYLLRLALEKMAGDLKDIESRHLEEMMMKVLDKPAGRKISLPGGIVFLSDYDCYRFTRDIPRLAPYPALEGETALAVPGTTRFAGWRFAASVITPGAMKPEADPLTAYFDFDRTGSELSVRGRRRGDRFEPLGLDASKKVGEFMISAKIPSYLRERVPLVVSREGIIWLVGYRTDERVKVTPKTKRILRLRAIKPTSS
ncbi:MAG: tRNA lysidine(34) synthetase TilS [Chloroflexota bacterium]